jgi:hypothetical protein
MSWPNGLVVEVGGHGVVSHAGSAAARLLADRTGMTGGLSGALARRGFVPLHDRGRVLADLAVAIADGATTIGEIDTRWRWSCGPGMRGVILPPITLPWRAPRSRRSPAGTAARCCSPA